MRDEKYWPLARELNERRHLSEGMDLTVTLETSDGRYAQYEIPASQWAGTIQAVAEPDEWFTRCTSKVIAPQHSINQIQVLWDGEWTLKTKPLTE